MKKLVENKSMFGKKMPIKPRSMNEWEREQEKKWWDQVFDDKAFKKE